MKNLIPLSEVFKMHAAKLYASASRAVGKPFSVLISDAEHCELALTFKTKAEADQLRSIFSNQGIDCAVCETESHPKDTATGYKMYVATGSGGSTLSCDCD